MDCDVEDLSCGFPEVLKKELNEIGNFISSKIKISDLSDYQVSGYAVGTILGILSKGLEEEQTEEMIVLAFKAIDETIHPIDFWGKFEDNLLIRCSELENWFHEIKGSNKEKGILGTLSKVLVFAGNTVTGGMLGEVKDAFEGLFSLLGKAFEQVSTPENFEELCSLWIDYSFCIQLLHYLRSKRIYYPVCGTKRIKSLIWMSFYLNSYLDESQDLEQFLEYEEVWKTQTDIVNSTIKIGAIDNNLNLTIFGKEQGLEGTVYDNSVPGKIWKEIKGFYKPLPFISQTATEH